jgi:small subunit ribosomal protein S6
MGATYDLMLLLDTAVEEDRREKVLSDVEVAIAASGSIESRHDWGPRTMAYEIRHKADARYHLFQFTGPRELLEQLDSSLRINDAVVRHRIIKLRSGMPPTPELRPERPPAEAPVAGPA